MQEVETSPGGHTRIKVTGVRMQTHQIQVLSMAIFLQKRGVIG